MVWPWIGAALLVIALLSPQQLQLYMTVAVVIASGVLIMTREPSHPVCKLLGSWWMVKIGLLSYSLYLYHWSVLAISRWTMGVQPCSAPFQLLAMFGLASLSYAIVERPLRRAKWSRFRLAAIGYGLTSFACAAGVLLALKSDFKTKLYTGVPAKLAAKGVETLLDGKRLDGTVQWRARDCVLASEEDLGKQISLDRCTLGNPSSRKAPRFLVVGNSYSAAELEMYTVLGDTGQGLVSLTSSWGASPTPNIQASPTWAKQTNAYYWNDVIPSLISQLSTGDVLVLISDLSDLSPATQTEESQMWINVLKEDMAEIARKLKTRGIKIIFQSGTPFMREAQCAPDAAVKQWFQFGNNGSCVYYSKEYTLNRLRPLNEALREVERKNDNFYVFDLFSTLCEDNLCAYQNAQGTFLFRDIYSHPSLEASALGRQAFLTTAKRAVETATSRPRPLPDSP